MPKLRSQIIPVSSIDETLKRDLFALFEKYYVEISYSLFCADLAEKDHVLLCWDGNRVIGFSTAFRRRIPEIGPGVFLFSGDTVMHEDYWGSNILKSTFFRYIV